MADVNDSNRLENLIGEDLDPKWNEPSTRGDLRLLAIRIDTKFDQVRGDFHTLKSEIDSRFEQLRGDFRLHSNGIDSKFEQLRGDFRLHSNGIDSKFELLRGDFLVLANGIGTKFGQFRAGTSRSTIRIGMIFFGAIMTANLSMFGIFAALLK